MNQSITISESNQGRTIVKRIVSFIVLVGIGIVFSIAYADGASFKAGVAKTVITPKTNMWMSGYASRKTPSEGKAQDLFAKALALEDSEGHKAVIVTMDLIGIGPDISTEVAARVEKKLGIPRSGILFSCSHTHSGPVLRNNLEVMYALPKKEWDLVTKYTADLKDQLTQTILDAVAQMKPANLHRGNGQCGFAINRREYTPTGNRIGHNPIGPVDHDVPTLKVTDENGNVKAVLFGYACHNTTLSFFQFCGDYAGYAQEYLEKENPGTVALYFAGCGADQNPHPRRELAHAKQHGLDLCRSVQKVLSGDMREVSGPIRTIFSTPALTQAHVPDRAELDAMLEDKNVYKQRLAQSLLAVLKEKGQLPETYPYPIQTWQIGDDFTIVALGGEVVVDYSLLLKHKYGKDKIWVVAYSNDVCSYIPSLRVLHEGGYEAVDSMTYYGFPSPWTVTVEETVVGEIDRQIQAVR